MKYFVYLRVYFVNFNKMKDLLTSKCDLPRKIFRLKNLSLLLVCCLLTLPVFAQERITVSGRVIDETGQTVPYATVLVKGTKTAVSADLDGNYSISVAPDATLEFSSVGYTSVREPVNGRTNINVTMVTGQLLDEVVVVGYGSQKAKDLTAPIAVIKGEELSKQISSNAAQALQGKVAGVQVINGGAPGAGASIRIRGVGSMGDETTKPLYVVDGAFVDNIDFLSSSDIESMNVLKDASASAIYGVRAANGVVLITTKKGVGGKPVITYDGYVALQTPVNVMPMVTDKNQYVELVNKANENTSGYVPKRAEDFPTSTDWYDQLLRNAFMQNHSLDVSGATETTGYSLGFNYFGQDGILNADNSYQRYNLRGRFEQKVTNWLKLGANTIVSNYTKLTADENSLRQAYVNAPVYPVYNENNTLAYPEKFDSPQNYGFGNSYGNPMGYLYYNDNKEKGKIFLFSIFADFNIIDQKLNFRVSYNQDYTSLERKVYVPEYFIGGSQGQKQSSLTETFENRTKQIIDNLLTYTDRIDAHSFTVLLGQSTRMEKMNNLWGSAVGVPGDDDKAKYLKNGSYKDRNTDDGGFSYNGLSAFMRATYSYDEKYLASFTFRADASSKYQDKWGFFPSLGLGWVLTKEKFMENQKFFDFLKIRASWGMLGNDNIPGNSTVIVGTRSVGTSAVFGDRLVDGVGAQTVYQNYLKWEVVTEYDLGVDYSCLQGRLTGEIDGYYRVTDNVVFTAPVASGGGVADLLSNNGKILNAGAEFTIRWAEKKNDKFSYNIGLNLTTIHNEVLKLEGKEYIAGASVRGGYATRTAVGHPIGSFYGYKVIGVYQTEKEALLDPVKPLMRDKGYFRYEDTDGNNKIDDNDKQYLGSPIPWLMGGLDFGFNYGNWDFGLTLQGQVGNKILNAKRLNRDVYADGNYDQDFYKNHWDGSGSSNTYPSAEAYNSSAVQNPNSFFVEDGSYLRIQNVQAGYTFDKIKYISKLRVYVSAQRPFTLFGYNGFTPEVGGSPTATGIDNSVYPMQSIYSLGLKFNF